MKEKRKGKLRGKLKKYKKIKIKKLEKMKQELNQKNRI
jgi:hypothetical protein